MALPPQPPTPMTLIFAPLLKLSANSIIYTSFLNLLLKELFEPPFHPFKQFIEYLFIPPFKHCYCRMFSTIQNQPHACRIHGAPYNINKSADAYRQAPPDRKIKNLLCQLDHAI